MVRKVALPRLVAGVALALAMFMTVKLQAVTVTITAAAVCDQQTGAFRISYTASQAQTYQHQNPSVNISFDGVVVDNGAFTLPALSFSDTLNAPAGKGAGDVVTVTADVVGMYDNGVQPGPGDVTASTQVTLPDDCTPPVLLRGCTPGYWKQSQHFDSWPAGYTPNMLFNDLPGFPNAYPGMTLLQVLSLNGGGLNALGRHTVAAILNSASGFGVDLTALQNAFTSNWQDAEDAEALHLILEALNEIGCPLN